MLNIYQLHKCYSQLAHVVNYTYISFLVQPFVLPGVDNYLVFYNLLISFVSITISQNLLQKYIHISSQYIF